MDKDSKNIDVQEFNNKNKLFLILLNYLKNNYDEFDDRKNDDFTRNFIYKFITNNGIYVNNNFFLFPGKIIQDGDIVTIEDYGIRFVCKKNPNYNDMAMEEFNNIKAEEYKKNIIDNQLDINKGDNINKDTYLDKIEKEEVNNQIKKDKQKLNEIRPKAPEEVNYLINQFLTDKLEIETIELLNKIEHKKGFAQIILLYQLKGFDYIKHSDFSWDLTGFIKSKLMVSNIPKEIDISKSILNFDGKLIDLLIQAKAEKENSLMLINNDILNGHFDHSLYKYLEEYRKLFKTDLFQYLVNPLLDNNLSSPIVIENLIKPVSKSLTIEGIEEKFIHYENSKPVFIAYFDLLEKSDEYTKNFYHCFADYLFKLLKVNCNTAVEKAAQIKVEATNRKYNFSNLERLEQELFLIVSNIGEGLAKNVIIVSTSDFFGFNQINLGILKPNEKRDISVMASIKHTSDVNTQLSIDYFWEEVSGKKNNSKSIVKFLIQKVDVNWEELKKQNPYSNSIIEKREKLYGRDDILNDLKSNILSDNIESYKLWGQKRVGKSSIVKTLKSILDTEEKVIIVFRSLGGLRNTNPLITFNSLGESLCSEVYEEIDRKIKDSSFRERLRSVVVPVFNGSFLPLEIYIKQLKKIDNSLKFVFILDEFDRINEEFFLPGNLGETLSLSIGKGLNENNYIGFILVGSENMHLLDRQGINYNSYHEKEVDTFHKQTEYNSFVQIVKGPVLGYLNYSDEAIEKIFHASNGNPYFANLICANIWKNAYKFKDYDIDVHFVNDAITTIINSFQKSHFEHFWSDGITEESNIKKDRKADIRRRILVSFSMSTNLLTNCFPTVQEIVRNFRHPIETEYIIERYEVENTINEFSNRKIFVINNLNQVRILPNLFESWLCGKGKTLMIEGVSDLEALQREIDLEREISLKPDELNRLSETFHFKGIKITTEKFIKYFKQFGGASEQRRIFKLLDAIFFISKDDLMDFYRKESKNIFTKKEILIREGARTVYKEKVELYTFSKNFKENISVVESFKLLNHIRPQKHLKTINDDSLAWKKNSSEEIIIIEPIIETYSDIQNELFHLLNNEIKNSLVPIRILTFIITTKAKADLITSTSSFPNLKLIAYKEVEVTKIKPFIQGTEIFENIDEASQAFYEVRKLFPNSNKETLLVLFEDFCPSSSCPILWHKKPQFTPLFLNEFGKLEEPKSAVNEEEKSRTRIFHANTELSQALNAYFIKYLKKKAKESNKEDWFIRDFIPRSVMETVSAKWISDGTSSPKESYFDFSDYKKIIDINQELISLFKLPGEDLSWFEKLNVLRRDPAHPEKPPPTEKEAEYFEKITKLIVSRLELNNIL